MLHHLKINYFKDVVPKWEPEYDLNGNIIRSYYYLKTPPISLDLYVQYLQGQDLPDVPYSVELKERLRGYIKSQYQNRKRGQNLIQPFVYNQLLGKDNLTPKDNDWKQATTKQVFFELFLEDRSLWDHPNALSEPILFCELLKILQRNARYTCGRNVFFWYSKSSDAWSPR